VSGTDREADISGILIIAKPTGPTSHDVVALVRRLSGIRRVGHGGTLDPFASGVLPVFLGRSTRLVEYHLGDRKRYRATICFGARSTTDDLDGELTPVGIAPDRATVEAALAAFRGEIEQVPPSYSAINVGGRRAYALARAGITPQLAPRTVTIQQLDLLDWDDTDADRPLAIVDVECSAGTYIRAIARDLGARIGSGAYLGALVRLASGAFVLDDAVSLEVVRTAATSEPPRLAELVRPATTGLERFPRAVLSEPEVVAITRGQFVRPSRPIEMPDGPEGRLRLFDEADRLVAIARWSDGRLAPEKVLVDRVGDPTDA